jgi:hypothetical protein
MIRIAIATSLAGAAHDAQAASYVRMHCDNYLDTLVFQDLETGGTLRSSGSHNWAITGSWTFGPARPYNQPQEYIWSFGLRDGSSIKVDWSQTSNGHLADVGDEARFTYTTSAGEVAVDQYCQFDKVW